MNDFNDDVIDEDIPDEDEVADLPPPPPLFTESELEAAKQQAFQDGYKDAKQEAAQSREQALANLMQKLAYDLQMLFIAENERAAIYEREAVELSYAIFKQSFPALHAKFGFEELKAQMALILTDQHGQSSIEIRVADDYVAGVESFIDTIQQKNKDIRCTVMRDDHIGEGAFHLAWKDGGAIYNSQAIAQSILANLEEILARKSVTSHDDSSEESNASGDDVRQDVAHDDIRETSIESPEADNNPIAEDDTHGR